MIDGDTIKGTVELVCKNSVAGCNSVKNIANKNWNDAIEDRGYKTDIEFKLVLHLDHLTSQLHILVQRLNVVGSLVVEQREWNLNNISISMQMLGRVK